MSWTALFRIFALPLMIGVSCAAVVRATAIRFYEVPSGSMRPTLEPGDVIAASPWGGEVRRGDVVVFRDAMTGTRYVKRVVALGGDHVRIENGVLYLNGDSVAEPYVRGGGSPPQLAEIVPSRHVWVLGDNREDSTDSRMIGPVALEQIEARMRWVVYSRAPEPADDSAS